jgi:hypothetical protein
VYAYQPDMTADQVRETAARREDAWAAALHSLIDTLASVGNLVTFAERGGEPVDLVELRARIEGKLDRARDLTDFHAQERRPKGALAFRALAFAPPDTARLYADEVECPRCKSTTAQGGAPHMTLADLVAMAGRHECLPRVLPARPGPPHRRTRPEILGVMDGSTASMGRVTGLDETVDALRDDPRA